jgi:hypothetical protein
LLSEGFAVPDKDEMQDILKANNIISPIAFFRAYLAKSGSVPGIELLLAYQIISQNNGVISANQTPGAPTEGALDESAWYEAARYLRGALDSLDALSNLPYILDINPRAAKQSQTMSSLSKPYLANIESLLERKPTSGAIWRQWFFWRGIEGAERPAEPLVDRIKYSPLSPMIGTLPGFVMDIYYEECKKSGNWLKVIGLLKTIWDREISKINIPEGEIEKDSYAMRNRQNTLSSLGRIAIPLIEAYLHDGKARFADEVFNTCLDSGGKFVEISKIVELAKEKGHEGIAKGWEEKAKK